MDVHSEKLSEVEMNLYKGLQTGQEREFQILGPATEEAPSPKRILVLSLIKEWAGRSGGQLDDWPPVSCGKAKKMKGYPQLLPMLSLKDC